MDSDNLTLTAAAGTTVAEARAQAEAVSRILPLDPGHPGRATIGGVAATGDNGARAAGYGGLRDVVLGVRATLADGSAVKSGGRVMKNVSGYDMTKLFLGSLGVLGVITEVTFRLLPRYDSQALVVLPLASLEEAKGRVARILASHLEPLALEVVSAGTLPAGVAGSLGPGMVTPGRPVLLAGFGGHRAAVDRSVREVTEGTPQAAAQVMRDDAAEALYQHLTDGADAGAGDGDGTAGLGLRASVPISRALDVVLAAQSCADASGLTVDYRAGAARGRVDLVFAAAEADGDTKGGSGRLGFGADGFAACLTQTRADATRMGGSLFVTGGARLLPSGYDTWGDLGPAVTLMKRIKERFDPRECSTPAVLLGGSDERPGSPANGGREGPGRRWESSTARRVFRGSTIPSSPAASAASASPRARSSRDGPRGPRRPGQGRSVPQHRRGRASIGPDMKDAFANCLLCRACTESCFSSVQTDKVVVSFRHAYADRFGRGLLQRGVFRSLLPRPRFMRGLVRTMWALRRTGLPDLARRAGLVGLLNPKLERAMELREGTPGPLLHSRLENSSRQAIAAVPGSATPLVGYWMSCGYNYVLPEVGEATVTVLERLGNRVEVLDNCCCGLAAYGYGDLEAAKKLARENLRRLGHLDRFEAIVSECGSCSGHLKEYAELLADDPEWVAKAEALSRKMRSFSEFVQEKGGLPEATDKRPMREPAVVTYHDPCHLGRRYQNVTTRPGRSCGRWKATSSGRRWSQTPAAERPGPTECCTPRPPQLSSTVRPGSSRTRARRSWPPNVPPA